jgi:hypothetical protein
MSKKPRMRPAFDLDPITGRIVGDATNSMGEGGNYIPAKKDREKMLFPRLSGKATEGSFIRQRKDFINFFTTDDARHPDRSELAVPKNFAFERQINIDLEFRVKGRNYDKVTGYVLQFWQPIVSPIAGIRIQNGTLAVVSRSAGGALSMKLEKKKWYDWQLQFKAGDNGFIRVIDDTTGKLIGSRNGTINAGSQAGQTLADTVKPKFGFYGNALGGIKTDFRDFAIALEAL